MQVVHIDRILIGHLQNTGRVSCLSEFLGLFLRRDKPLQHHSNFESRRLHLALE